MRRLLLVGMFVIALFSMLCVGFIMGALFSSSLGRVGQVLEQRFNFSRGIPGIEPRSRIRIPQSEFPFAQQGVIIIEVVSGSPADRAGLQPREIIVSLNGKSLEQPADLIENIAKLKPGDLVTMEVMQPGETKREITVKLGENPDRKEFAWLGIRIGPSMQMPELPDWNDDGQMPVLP